jgi:hypothetical protein
MHFEIVAMPEFITKHNHGGQSRLLLLWCQSDLSQAGRVEHHPRAKADYSGANPSAQTQRPLGLLLRFSLRPQEIIGRASIETRGKVEVMRQPAEARRAREADDQSKSEGLEKTIVANGKERALPSAGSTLGRRTLR